MNDDEVEVARFVPDHPAGRLSDRFPRPARAEFHPMRVDVDALLGSILALPEGPAVPWFLDIDGVLNLVGTPTGEPPADWPEYRSRQVDMSTQLAVPFTWAPALVECLNLLVERGHLEVRWLTSWGPDAQLCAAPAIGLLAGGVAEPLGDPADELAGGPWWKWRVVHAFAATGAACIWADDFLEDKVGTRAVDDACAGSVLALSPDPGHGLTPQHLRQIVGAVEPLRNRTWVPRQA